MISRYMFAAALAVFAVSAPAAASPDPGSGAMFTVKNDTGKRMECAIKKAGSGVSEELWLRPGEELTRTYPSAKQRNFRCIGANPIWYVMQPGLRYHLMPNRDGLIVLVAAQ